MLDLFSFHLISSRRSFSWKLLIASHCHRSLSHPISSHPISPHVVSSQNFPPRLISSHVLSPFLISSPLITTALISTYCVWACLISSQLIWTLLFSALLSSSILRSLSQLSSSHVRSFQHIPSRLIRHISALLAFSHLSSFLLTSSQLISALLNSCQLFSRHLSSSQLTLRSSQLFSGPKPVPKPDPGSKATKGYKRYDFEFWRLCNSKFTVKKDNGNKKLIVATLAQPFQWDLQAASCKRP